SLPDYDLLYRLTPTTSDGRRTWTVDVRRRDQQAQGPIQVKRFLTSGTRLSPVDERIFAELSRHESRYDARVVLNDEDLCELLPLLAERRVIYRGPPLVFSAEQAHLQVHLESLAEGAIATLEFRLPPDLALPLRDGLVLAGRGSFLICGQTVYRIQPYLPARL